MLPAGTSGGRFRPNYNNTGRERAVDELVDASPEGSFARALSIQVRDFQLDGFFIVTCP